MSESQTGISDGPATAPLSDDVLERVTGGVASPLDSASGQAGNSFVLEIDGTDAGWIMAKKKQHVRAVGELLENQ